MRRRLFRQVLSLALIGGACITASQTGLAGPKKVPRVTASEPAKLRATRESDLTDAQVLGVADATNDGEIALATVASSKAQSEPVKQFAQLMLKDHGAAKEKGRALATKLQLKPSASSIGNALQKQTDDVMGRLEKAGSLEFDRVYMESQVRLHQRVLQIFDDMLPQIASRELKGLILDMREHVEHHLAVARNTLSNR